MSNRRRSSQRDINHPLPKSAEVHDVSQQHAAERKAGHLITVENIKTHTDASEIVLSASVRAPVPLPDRMWFGVPAGQSANVAADADPFLPVLMIVGMAHHLPLEVPEVSTELLHGCSRVMEIYEAWSTELGDSLRRMPIRASGRPRERRGRAAGAFFSGGVDSTYTVLRNHDRYPPGDARRIQYLVLGHGLDVPLDNHDLFSRVLATAQEFAQAHDVELIPVRTNVRAFTSDTDWGHYAHGPCLAAVGHVLSPLLHTLYVASSYWFTTLKPWSSHPDIDSRWSSERIEFVHQGLEATRADKMLRIAASDVALRTLRVCWRNAENTFNCGRCEKCIRTMFALSCCGALERASRFPSRLDPALIAQLTLKPSEVPFWEDNLRLAGGRAADSRLVETLRRTLEGHRFRHTALGHVDAAIRSAFSRVGLTTERLQRWDERHFKSRLTHAIRAVKHRVGGQGSVL